MILRLYTIMDRVAEDSAPPFTAINDGVARRQFNNLLNNSLSSDEYSLYYLGFYDTSLMKADILITPQLVDMNQSIHEVVI
nr:MAG: nonstructural protein [Microviridae sp.]